MNARPHFVTPGDGDDVEAVGPAAAEFARAVVGHALAEGPLPAEAFGPALNHPEFAQALTAELVTLCRLLVANHVRMLTGAGCDSTPRTVQEAAVTYWQRFCLRMAEHDE